MVSAPIERSEGLNGRFRRVSLVPIRPADGPLSEPTHRRRSGWAAGTGHSALPIIRARLPWVWRFRRTERCRRRPARSRRYRCASFASSRRRRALRERDRHRQIGAVDDGTAAEIGGTKGWNLAQVRGAAATRRDQNYDDLGMAEELAFKDDARAELSDRQRAKVGV
jgi:hypothetical protein